MRPSNPSVILELSPDGTILCCDLIRSQIAICEQAIQEGNDERIGWAKRELGCAILFAVGREDKDWLKRRYPTKPRRGQNGFIYLVRNNRNLLTKIGWSSKPSFREKTLQSEEPEVEMIYMWPGSLSDERAIHTLYLDFRVRGEWFKLSETQISEIKAAHPE